MEKIKFKIKLLKLHLRAWFTKPKDYQELVFVFYKKIQELNEAKKHRELAAIVFDLEQIIKDEYFVDEIKHCLANKKLIKEDDYNNLYNHLIENKNKARDEAIINVFDRIKNHLTEAL